MNKVVKLIKNELKTIKKFHLRLNLVNVFFLFCLLILCILYVTTPFIDEKEVFFPLLWTLIGIIGFVAIVQTLYYDRIFLLFENFFSTDKKKVNLNKLKWKSLHWRRKRQDFEGIPGADPIEQITFSSLLNKIKEKDPLIHCVTNYVSVNDCANSILAVGASPFMSENWEEIKDISQVSDALYVNIGTITKNSLKAIHKSLRFARENKIPIILDPVGINVSKFRKEVVRDIILKYRPAVIKGNLAEIKSLVYDGIFGKGTNATSYYNIKNEDVKLISQFCKFLAKQTSSIICVTGKIDIISDSEKSYAVYNGNPKMQDMVGTGCILGSLLATAVATTENHLDACVLMTSLFGLCGQKAINKNSDAGNSSLRNYVIDEIYKIEPYELEFGIFYEVM
ncbi:MAG: hydroxyethylthiazole kinase [Mycoplasma sp.]